MNVRRNQSSLTKSEWDAFVKAINATHGIGTKAPAYRDFVQVHVRAMTTAQGMTWGVHTMPPPMGMVGINFLAWHRQYLRQFEKRLAAESKGITIPYWDWTVDRQIPVALSGAKLLRLWSVTRDPVFKTSMLPSPDQLAAVMARQDFEAFQSSLEGIHGLVHIAVGGDMNSAASPTDPLFWLHHANVDRIWSEWEAANPKLIPPNSKDTLEPPLVAGTKMFGVTVSSVLDITKLGYRYA